MIIFILTVLLLIGFCFLIPFLHSITRVIYKMKTLSEVLSDTTTMRLLYIGLVLILIASVSFGVFLDWVERKSMTL